MTDTKSPTDELNEWLERKRNYINPIVPSYCEMHMLDLIKMLRKAIEQRNYVMDYPVSTEECLAMDAELLKEIL